MKEYICAETHVKNYAGDTTGTTLWKGKELVRCKNCSLRYTNKCVLHDQAFPVNKSDDWFCADGERK